MKRFLIYSVIVLLSVSNLFAQDNNKPIDRKHGIGIGVGSTTGYGLSYTYFPGKVGFLTNTFFYLDEDVRKADLGGMVMYSLYRGQNHVFFTYLSGYYHYRYDKYFTYDYPTYVPVYYINEEKEFHMGPGVGVEIYKKNFGVNMHIGFAAYNNFSTFSMLAGGIAIHYRF